MDFHDLLFGYLAAHEQKELGCGMKASAVKSN
jgi:hypothetical protein